MLAKLRYMHILCVYCRVVLAVSIDERSVSAQKESAEYGNAHNKREHFFN